MLVLLFVSRQFGLYGELILSLLRAFSLRGLYTRVGKAIFFSVRASSSGLIGCSDLGIISIEQTTENAFAYATY